MGLHRGIDGSDPLRPEPIGHLAGAHEERRVVNRGRLGLGTLACPGCDAPVALTTGPLAPAHPLACPYCGRAGAVRDFLSLTPPARPARVEVRVVQRTRGPARLRIVPEPRRSSAPLSSPGSPAAPG